MKNNWERPALGNYRGELFTFGELAAQIAKFHVFFEAIGLKKGDKVALCAKNSARWGVTFFAANTYEAVLVPILADFHPESVNSLVDHSESKVLLTDSDIWAKLDIAKMPTIKAVISSSDFSLLYAADETIKSASDNLQSLFEAKYPNGFSAADINYPTDNDSQRTDAFELWCWRKLLRVPGTARRSNQSIQKEISPGVSLEGMMLKLKLQYFGQLI